MTSTKKIKYKENKETSGNDFIVLWYREERGNDKTYD